MAVNVSTIRFLKPLSKLSYDQKNKISVCPYVNKFVDFDHLKMELPRKKPAKSPDMLFCHEGRKEVWFVEFKSSSEENLDKQKFYLKRKALDGLIQFYEIFQKFYDYKKYYVVIFPKEKNAEDEVVNSLSREKIVLFDLEELQGKFYNGVLTDNCDALKREFRQRFNITFQQGN